LADLFEHFKELNEIEENRERKFPLLPNPNYEILDRAINEEDIRVAAKSTKSGKACGIDSVLNDHIK
jgi:hypothetical protein